jgi:hypothetical protein
MFMCTITHASVSGLTVLDVVMKRTAMDPELQRPQIIGRFERQDREIK